MNDLRISFKPFLIVTIGAAALILIILLATGPVFAHGGKKHADSFTALQALKKGTDLYDQLVGSGKLGESWETDLANVEITNRQKSGQKEYVVSFQRGTGETKTVYIFFTADGKYAGSNFTGE